MENEQNERKVREYTEEERRAAADRVVERVRQEAIQKGKMPKKKFVRRLVKKEPALHSPEAVSLMVNEYDADLEDTKTKKLLKWLFD